MDLNKSIRILQKYIRSWYKNINKLESIKYKHHEIKFNDINVFYYKNRSNNDSNNKKAVIKTAQTNNGTL